MPVTTSHIPLLIILCARRRNNDEKKKVLFSFIEVIDGKFGNSLDFCWKKGSHREFIIFDNQFVSNLSFQQHKQLNKMCRAHVRSRSESYSSTVDESVFDQRYVFLGPFRMNQKKPVALWKTDSSALSTSSRIWTFHDLCLRQSTRADRVRVKIKRFLKIESTLAILPRNKSQVAHDPPSPALE